MKEFIVWDDFAKEFYDNKNSFYENDCNNKCVLLNGRVEIFVDEEYDSSVFYPYKEKDKLIPLWDIGLKDTNRKSIYADCSIVEFIYRPIGESRTCRDIGFIFFCKEDFMFKINILTRSDKNGDNYIFNLGNSLNNMYMKEIKIIDTIQENKLGLIK